MTSNWLYYLRACRALLPHLPSPREKLGLLRFYPRWSSSLAPQANALDDAAPWITFAAAEVLTDFLRQRDTPRVFEFGSGGSTLFFLNLGAEVVSVEHDEKWYRAVAAKIPAGAKQRWQGHLCPATEKDTLLRQDSAEDSAAYFSSAPEYRGMSFQNYAQAIDAYPDDYFDLILLDGRARPSCFTHAEKKVRSGGLLVLDNSERPHYKSIHDAMQAPGAWDRVQCPGPGPYNRYFWDTTLWTRRKD